MDEIVIRPQQNTSIITSFTEAERAASAMAASGFFQDSRTAAQAVVKILAGQEMGFGPFASMTGVVIIQGKPAVGANLQASAIKRSGKYNYKILEMSDDSVELEFYEMGKSIGKSKFSMADARAAGLTDKEVWKKFRRNMLFARALSNGVKWYTPDVFNGATVYTPEELGATEDGDGNIVSMPSEDFNGKKIEAVDVPEKKESVKESVKQLCIELAQENKPRVVEMIKVYEPSGLLPKIKDEETLEKLLEDLINFKESLKNA